MEHASVIFLWIAYLLYAGAFAVFVVQFLTKSPTLTRVGLVVAAAGLAFHTLTLVFRGLSAGHVPFVGAYESLVMVAWSIALVWFVLESFTRMRAVGLYVLPVVVLLLTVAWVAYKPPQQLVPALRSDIVILHVIVMLTAIGCLYVAGGAGIIYLIEESLLRRRKAGGVLGRLPSLGALEKLIYHATLMGLPFLTAGMLAGIIRAETFNVPSWWIDPMVLLALVAWALYAVLLWGRMRADWVGSRIAWLAIIGLVVLLVIRFAAVPYLSGFHTYGG
ncbi:MAG: cytochrome c biogenesis protein CcsA [Actinobacteria bacterium]|nr:cytochrome c biogenesis protein CcsA [Actinomycetota bacterium]